MKKQNMLPDSTKKSTSLKAYPASRKKFEPPIDFYGVSPTFYIDGEDKTSSWLGCICSVVLGIVMIAVTVSYFVAFSRKSDVTVYNKVESLSKIPFVDLKESRFILVVRGNYPEDKPFRDQMSSFLTLSVDTFESKPKRIIPEALPFEYNRISKALIPCSELKTDISDVNYSENDLKDSFCLEFDSKFEMGGSYTDGLLRSFVLNLRPCVRTSPEQCRPKRYNPDGSFT